MKFRVRKSESVIDWRPWFAWFPVAIYDKTTKLKTHYVWLEWVERKSTLVVGMEDNYWEHEHREIEPSDAICG